MRIVFPVQFCCELYVPAIAILNTTIDLHFRSLGARENVVLVRPRPHLKTEIAYVSNAHNVVIYFYFDACYMFSKKVSCIFSLFSVLTTALFNCNF